MGGVVLPAHKPVVHGQVGLEKGRGPGRDSREFDIQKVAISIGT